MTVKVCADEVIAAVARKQGKAISKAEAEEIVDQLNVWLKRHKGVVDSDTLNNMSIQAQKISLNAKIAAKIEKRNALINKKRYLKIITELKNSDNPSKTLSGILVGDVRTRLDSVDAKGHAIMVDSMGTLAVALSEAQVLDMFRLGDLDEKVYIEMFDGLGSSGDVNARKIAEIIRKHQKNLLDRKNRAGANIGELENYVVRQMHDPLLMMKNFKDIEGSKAEWVAFIKPLLNKEKTFDGLSDKVTSEKSIDDLENDFLGEIFTNLVTGNHNKSGDLNSIDGKRFMMDGFSGPKNLAKSMSQSRVLHLKDGISSYKYSKRYARMTLSEGVLSGFTHDAQSIALLETFGTNPRSMFDKIIKDIEGTKDINILRKLRKKSLYDQFAELDGTTRQKGISRNFLGMDVSIAGISAGWRMIQNMSKLGFATISSFSDISTKAAFIHANTERGVFSSYGRAFIDVFEGFKNTKQKKELGYLLGVGVDNMLNDVHARFGANDSGPGKMAKAHQFFFKLNGMQWWNNSQKTGLARMLAADLAVYANRSFDKVPPETQRLLKLYDIDESDWTVFSQLVDKAQDGRKYVVASKVDELSNDVIDSIIRNKEGTLDITDKLRQDFRDKFRTKINMYYADSADAAIPTPGARERAIMNQGLPRGTVLGEAIRMIMQLKGFPITYITKGLTRQKAHAGYYGVAKMMVGSTVMGYLSICLKDVLRGREPREVFLGNGDFNTKLLQQAFLQGGGAGIYGDFIFNEYNRYGRSFQETLLGPTAGAVDDVAKIFGKFASGDVPTQKLTKLALENTPFINLFYTKLALDYLFLHDLQELAKPGFLRKMEHRINKDFEQDFFISPQSTSGILR